MFDRCVPLDETIGLVPKLRERYNITRIADLTFLDRAYIPVACAIVPNSPDLVSVYNGKGVSWDAARIGAVMEAAERQEGAQHDLRVRYLRFRRRRDAVHLGELGLSKSWWDTRIAAVQGYDLMRDEDVHVPLACVRFPQRSQKMFAVTSTNGLASGNTFAEAVFHALVELVERHVCSVAHVRATLLPQLMVEEFVGASIDYFPDAFKDDPVGRRIMTPTGYARVDELLKRLSAAGLSVRLTALASDPLPLTVAACVSEPARTMAHIGLGCSWSPEHAVLRALTEAAQCRAVDIQGARENLVRASDPPMRFGDHARRPDRLPFGRWYFDAPLRTIKLSQLPDQSSQDLTEDLRRLVDGLRFIGVDRIVIVDLSPPGLPIAVVRAVVPRLESFMLDYRIGPTIGRLLGSDQTRIKQRINSMNKRRKSNDEKPNRQNRHASPRAPADEQKHSREHASGGKSQTRRGC